MRQCPVCPSAMNSFDHEGVTLDLCSGCKGLWFDPGELRRVVGDLFELMAPGAVLGEGASRGSCPACSAALSERALKGGGSLRIDACQRCEGVFLDAGELQAMRQLASRQRRAARRRDEAQLAQRHAARREQPLDSPGQPAFQIQSAYASRDNFFAFLTGLPMEEGESEKATPVAVVSLIGVLALAWVWQLGEGLDASIAAWGLVPRSLQAGENLLTLLSSIFLHGGWLHILGNVYALWVFGDNVERRVGSLTFLGYFLVWGLAGSLLSVVLTGPPGDAVAHIGASGAVAGAMGAYMVLYPNNRFIVPLLDVIITGWNLRIPAWLMIGLWGGVQLASGLMELPLIAWWAHLGGLLGGILVGLAYRRRVS